MLNNCRVSRSTHPSLHGPVSPSRWGVGQNSGTGRHSGWIAPALRLGSRTAGHTRWLWRRRMPRAHLITSLSTHSADDISQPVRADEPRTEPKGDGPRRVLSAPDDTGNAPRCDAVFSARLPRPLGLGGRGATTAQRPSPPSDYKHDYGDLAPTILLTMTPHGRPMFHDDSQGEKRKQNRHGAIIWARWF